MSWTNAISQLQIDNPTFQGRVLQHNGSLRLVNGDPIPFSDLYCLDADTGEDLLSNLTEQDLLAAEEAALIRIVEENTIEQVEANAAAQAANIPGWATWDEATALNWFDTNIGNNLPVTNLSEANEVLADMATLQRNLIRMVIALRNKTMAHLQE